MGKLWPYNEMKRKGGGIISNLQEICAAFVRIHHSIDKTYVGEG